MPETSSSSAESPSTPSGTLLFPKAIRSKKPRRPLLRRSPLKKSGKGLKRKSPLRRSSAPKKRMGPDPADFRDADIEAVYGPYPRCLVTEEWQGIDPSHILGRSALKFDDPRRRLYSSIYN